jgi:hypothetical protein
MIGFEQFEQLKYTVVEDWFIDRTTGSNDNLMMSFADSHSSNRRNNSNFCYHCQIFLTNISMRPLSQSFRWNLNSIPHDSSHDNSSLHVSLFGIKIQHF